MTGPDATEPDERPKSRPPRSEFGLPSWVDAAISRSKGDDQVVPAEEPETLESLQSQELEILEHLEVEPLDASESGQPEAEQEPLELQETPAASIAPAAGAPTGVTQTPKLATDETPPVRRGLAIPWLLAALLFAAAAGVMAFMIWFKPSR